jgi:hypothetical protein
LFSGAYSLEETRPLMAEACSWLGEQAATGTLEVAMIVGHWDISGAGAAKEMAVPAFYDEMRALPGCRDLDERTMLKFFMGHTHCNVPHPHGHVNTGFMVQLPLPPSLHVTLCIASFTRLRFIDSRQTSASCVSGAVVNAL